MPNQTLISIKQSLRNALSLDGRSIRLFRRALGLILILHSLELIQNADYFFSDKGVLPRWFFTLAQKWLAFSPLFWSGNVNWSIFIFTLLGGLGALLLMGYGPRTVSLLAFIVLVFCMHRAPYLQYGFDVLLRALCLWSALLPTRVGPHRILTAATIGVVAQVAILYGFSGFFKSADYWFWTPEAGLFSMSHTSWASSWGHKLIGYPNLLEWGTRGVFILERLTPVLLFVGGWRGRIAIISLLTCLHLGLSLSMELGLFPFGCLALLLSLLPSEIWDRTNQFTSSVSVTSPRVGDLSALILVLLFFAQNLTLMMSGRDLGREYRALHLSGFRQTWPLFAPYPSRFGGFFWLRAHNEKETSAYDFRIEEKRSHFQSSYPSFRWLVALREVTPGGKINLRLAKQILSYYCDKIVKLESETTRLDLVFRMNFAQPLSLRESFNDNMVLGLECIRELHAYRASIK
ncbi:MAG: hypothetical protein AB7F86_13130 [Bdellovibrionales bacterium]